MASILVCTIGVDTVTFQIDSLDIAPVLMGHDTITANIRSLSGAYVPVTGAEIIVTENGTRIFGGELLAVELRGADDQPIPQREYTVEAVAFSKLMENSLFTGTLAAGSLESQLLQLEADCDPPLVDYGVTLSGTQPTGPTMPAIELEKVTPWEALATLHQHTAGLGTPWFPRMSYSKVFDMYEAGTYASPTTFTVTNKKAVRDASVRKTREDRYNRAVLIFGPQAVVSRTDTFAGDGSTTAFVLTHDPLGNRGQGFVTVNGVREPILDTPVATAHWILSVQTLTRNTAPANLAVITFNYGVQYPQTVTADDATDQTANGVITRRFEEQGIVNMATALNYVAGKLALGIEDQETVTFTTREPLVFVGMSADIEIPDRDVDDTYLIVEMNIRTVGKKIVERTIRAQLGLQFHGTFRETFKAWGSSGGTRSSSSGGPTIGGDSFEDFGGGSGGLPAPFDTWDQFNENNEFGARSAARTIYQSLANIALTGVGVPAPSVSNTGSGSYPATIRYYKIQSSILSGTTATAISELGAVASFTPSGSGTHARVAKPTLAGSPTHWRVFGSADNVTFVAISAWIVVATTNYDDNVAPGSYAGESPAAPGSYTGGVNGPARKLFTQLTGGADAIVTMRSIDALPDGETKGAISFIPHSTDYLEQYFGAEYLNGQWIARSAIVGLLSHTATGDGNFGLTLYGSQTPGSPVDFVTKSIGLALTFVDQNSPGGALFLTANDRSGIVLDQIGLRDGASPTAAFGVELSHHDHSTSPLTDNRFIRAAFGDKSVYLVATGVSGDPVRWVTAAP